MKKIAASDSRQSVGMKWKLRKGLEENVGFKEDGTMEVGKNIEVDGTLTLNAPEDLAFKTGTISSEPEGYSVDGSGNVTIAGALKANNNGDVQVNKNLGVYGNISADGNKIAMGNFTYEGVNLPGITVLVEGAPYYWTPNVIINSQTGNMILPVFTNGDRDLLNDFTVSGYSLETSVALANSSSQAKYQHTVTIKGTRPAQGGGACFITFTAYSSKNTPIDSAQDLIDVFGGCDLSVSGMYSPSQGTNFGAVKLYLKGASTIADASLAYIDPSLINEAGVKMSECGNLSFADDVCIPK